MSIKEVFLPYLDDRRTPETFGGERDITGTDRVKYSRSAASLVEEVIMRMPRGIEKIDIRHGEEMMLKELFEQVVIDLVTVRDTKSLEAWHKKRTESLERLSNLINGMATVNFLLNH